MKKYRLGLDLGTNSIGWTVLSLDKDNQVESLIDMGVRIFSDGRDPKTNEPLAVARRNARGIRRNLHRKKQRRRQLFKLLQEEGLYPKEREKAQLLKTLDPYELRVKALDTILSSEELGRVLFHLSVRRGFKSNRKTDAEEQQSSEGSKETKDPTKMKQAVKLKSLLDVIKSSGSRTLGEFLYKNKEKGIRFVPERSTYYPLRSLYEEEFLQIKKIQEKKFKDINWDALHHAIFYQRPLRPQERGKCQFFTDKPRTYKAMPSSNRFRIMQDVLNLDMYDGDRKIPLRDEQTNKILDLLNDKEKLTFDAIRKALKTTNRFNLETDNRSDLKGNDTERKLRMDKHFGSIWDSLGLQEKDDIVELLITANEDSDVQKALSKYNLTDEQTSAIIKLILPSGTTSFSKEFTQEIYKVMDETRLQYHLAIKQLGFEHSEQKVDSYNLLPYYGKILSGSTLGGDIAKFDDNNPEKKYGKIGNPTVHVALNQLRVIVNALIKQYGKPEQIAIELSRDLKASRDSKREMLKKQTENTKRNAIINQNIKDSIKGIEYPGRFERLKFKLWEELGENKASRPCLYCGKNINLTELFTSNIEVEHILPFSRTLLDAESNKTLAHRACNAFKGEKTPFEAFGTNPKGFNWNEIMARVQDLKSKTKQGRFSQDAIENFEKDNAFIARQLTDNAYLSRISMRYLHSICDNIWAVNGGMTKMLRDRWDFDSFLKRKITAEEIAHFNLKDDMIGNYKKNRYDHRHHALDSLVIALTDRSLVQQIATANAYAIKDRLEVPPYAIPNTEIHEKLKSMVVSFKPDHGVEGKLSKETFLGKIKQEELIPISNITDKDIQNIKVDKVKEDFMLLLREGKSLKEIKISLKDVYPMVKVFKEIFVSRTSITSIKTEKNIEDIIDKKIKQDLQDYIAIHSGRKFEDLLLEFSEQKNIKKVRCKTRIQTPIEIAPDSKNPLSVHRYLNPEDYFVAIIWKIPPKKEGSKPTYQAQYVLRTDIDKNKEPILDKPHPAAKFICKLHKDDYIEFSEDRIWKKARIAGYAATQNKLDIRPIFATGSIKDWVIATNETMLEKGWKEIEGQYHISVNVLFCDKEARKITVSPLGMVNRKTYVK